MFTKKNERKENQKIEQIPAKISLQMCFVCHTQFLIWQNNDKKSFYRPAQLVVSNAKNNLL